MWLIPISTRREFLARGLGLIGIGTALPNFLVRAAAAGSATEPEGPILVVLQMTGGNDGLSTVVPYAHDEYARARRALRISASEISKLDDEVGLHPNLKGLRKLYDQGALAVIQGVGYPNPNQSHFTSMDIWHTADVPDDSTGARWDKSYGWIGRYCDHAFRGDSDLKLAVAIGNSTAPRAISGKDHTGLSFQTPATFGFNRIPADPQGSAAFRALRSIAPAASAANGSLDFVTQTASESNAAAAVVRELAGKYKSPTEYPGTPLAASLRMVAGLIAGGLNTRVYYVFQDGYDTHAGQRQRHDRLMADLDAAVTAFQKDLARQGNNNRVLTMTFSEFGRRAEENGSQGTDHGMAGPMFLIGPRVRAGVHGRHPSLTEDELVYGRDLKFQIDFRSVYATLLEKWLRTESRPVLGERFSLLDCVA